MEWFGTAMRPLDGGYSGETFLVGEGDDQVVLRIYQRSPDRALVDASLLRLVHGIVPVPRVIEVRQATAEQPAVLVTERLAGVPLDQLLAEPDRWPDLDRSRVARSIGSVLGRLSGMPLLGPGAFVSADLSVSMDGWPSDLSEFAQGFRDTGRLAAWQDRDWVALQSLIDLAADILESSDWSARTVLVHSDFNPKNLLVDTVTSQISGVVDWEFCHAGSPMTDLGNFCRFERDPELVEPLVVAFVDAAPGEMADPSLPARAADLWALVELAGGTPTNPVRDLAGELLLAQARQHDLEAWPFPGSRARP